MSIRYRTDNANKIAEIWVTAGTSEASVTACRKTLQERGYYCVIFRSGHMDLVQNTAALLHHNIYPEHRFTLRT